MTRWTCSAPFWTRWNPSWSNKEKHTPPPYFRCLAFPPPQGGACHAAKRPGSRLRLGRRWAFATGKHRRSVAFTAIRIKYRFAAQILVFYPHSAPSSLAVRFSALLRKQKAPPFPAGSFVKGSYESPSRAALGFQGGKRGFTSPERRSEPAWRTEQRGSRSRRE